MLSLLCKVQCRTPPGVRELKLIANADLDRIKQSRTPPGVRELKPVSRSAIVESTLSRTPPGVRELKLYSQYQPHCDDRVAPLPGCVN